MRIAIVYDCLYPYTVGGAERRYRSVVAQLAQRHEVTYLTRRQWNDAEALEVPDGVRCIAVSGGRRLYNAMGRRKISPPLRFGWGIFWHLARAGGGAAPGGGGPARCWRGSPPATR